MKETTKRYLVNMGWMFPQEWEAFQVTHPSITYKQTKVLSSKLVRGEKEQIVRSPREKKPSGKLEGIQFTPAKTIASKRRAEKIFEEAGIKRL